MDRGQILINVVNGQRRQFDGAPRLLVTAIDGGRRDVRRFFVPSGHPVRIDELQVHDNVSDRYTVLVAAKGHSDAGFNPVTIKANTNATLDLMMLRREAEFEFDSFDEVESKHPDLHAFLSGNGPDAGRSLYEEFAREQHSKPKLACLLNITTALGQALLTPFDGLDQNPLRSFKALKSPPQQDRLFAWADARLLEQVGKTAGLKGVDGLSRFATAPAALHPGATGSFKQIDFGEGNLQFSFHAGERQQVNGVDCMLVEVDIDYFQSAAAHILFEVFPNKLKSLIHGKESAKALTDPRTVYGLRWIAGRSLGREFAPPFVLN